jgi:hypothetical protein
MDANNDPLSIDAGEIANNLMGFVTKLKSGRADIGPF